MPFILPSRALHELSLGSHNEYAENGRKNTLKKKTVKLKQNLVIDLFIDHGLVKLIIHKKLLLKSAKSNS